MTPYPTLTGSDAPLPLYGCHDRKPYAPRVKLSPQLLLEHGEVVEIRRDYPFVMALDCQFTKSPLGRVDPRCAGCKHKGDADGK